MTYARLDTPRYRTAATTEWAEQIGLNFEADWTDRPTVSLVRSTDLTVPSVSYTAVTWTSAEWEVGDWWTSGSTITAPRAGWYFISVAFDWEASTAGYRVLGLADTGETQLPDETTGYCTHNLSTVTYLAAGQTQSLYVWQTSGGGPLTANGGKTKYQAVWLGEYDL